MLAFQISGYGRRSRAIRLGAAQLGLVFACLVLPPAGLGEAHAQGRLEARYQASLAGISVARGSWVVDIAEDRFTASADGGSSGLLNTFSGGKGSGVAEGRIVNGQLVPVSFVSTYASDKKSSTRIQFVGGNVKETSVEPEPEPVPDRIALTDAHRRGVVDPMTALLLQVPGTADPVSRDACASGRAVFSGQMRFDLRFEFKRQDTVKTKGYHGPAVVCAVYFTPIAGHVPDRPGIKYAAARRDMEVWLVPIAGTRVLVPYKVRAPTPLGLAVLEATQFVSTATVRTAAKSQ